MSIKPKFADKKQKRKDVKGVKLPGEYQDSRVEFKEVRNKKDLTESDYGAVDKVENFLSNYKLVLPVEIDQKEYIENSDKVDIHVLNTDTKKEKGVISKSFSIENMNNILNRGEKEITSQKNKDFLSTLKQGIKKIESKSEKTNKNQQKYNFLFSKFYENYENFCDLINELNKDVVADSQSIPISDAVIYKSNKNNGEKYSKVKDSDLFGTQTVFEIAKTGRGKDPDTQEFHIPQKITEEYAKNDNLPASITANNSFNELYEVGRDPAEIFEGNETHVGLPGAILGNVPESLGSIKQPTPQSLQKQIIDDVTATTNFSVNDTKSLEDKQKREIQYVCKSKTVSKRYKKLKMDVDLKKNSIDSKGNITVKLLRSNEKGLITQKKYKKINVMHHLSRHVLSSFNSENVTTNVESIDENRLLLTIKNFHNFDILFKAYVKIKNPQKIYDDNFFETLQTGVIEADSEVNIVVDNASLSSTMFRLTYGIKIPGYDFDIMTDNIHGLSFISKNTIKSEKSCYTFVLNDVNSKQMQISLYNLPNDALRFEYFRRNVTYSHNSPFEKLIDADSLLEVGLTNRTSIVDDYQLDVGNIYEYYAEIETISGSKYRTAPFREYYYESEDFVNIVVKGVQSNNLLGGTNNSKYQVDISKVDDRENTVKGLIDIIKELGDESFFDDDIKAINQASQELLSVEVEQLVYNKGCLEYKSLGIFKSGDTFNITTSSGQKESQIFPSYLKITPYQNSPLLIVSLVNDLISKIDDVTSNTNSNAVEKSVLLAKVKKKVDVFKINKDKYFSKDYLRDGKLPADVTPDLANGLNAIKKSSPVDDVFYFKIGNEVVQPFSALTITKTSFYRFQSNKKILLNFDITLSDDQKMIDFFILLAKKNKEYFPVTSFVAKGSSSYKVIDNTNKSYMGRLEYYLVPVDTSGNLLRKYFVKKVNLYDFAKI